MILSTDVNLLLLQGSLASRMMLLLNSKHLKTKMHQILP